MTARYAYLPGVLSEIADVAGLDAALKIAEARGGTNVHFPGRAIAGHWLTDLVGREAAEKICAHFRTSDRRGYYTLVPLGPKNFYQRARRIAEDLTKAGVSREEVARRVGVHVRTVQRYRGRLADVTVSDQGDLF